MPDGRTGLITSQTPPRDRERVHNFFQEFNVLDSVVAEANWGWGGWSHRVGEGKKRTSDTPAVIISRFRDNVYIAVISINPVMIPRVKKAVMTLLVVLYGLPLKWESHTDGVTWGEAFIDMGGEGVTLCRKGGTHMREYIGTKGVLCEWEKWVSVDSANARYTVNPYLPSLFLKSVWYAATAKGVITNFRSIARGIGARGYPCDWWSPLLKKFLVKYKLGELIPIPVFDRWRREAKGVG